MKSIARTASPYQYFAVLGLTLVFIFSVGCSRDPEQRDAYKAFLEELTSSHQGYRSLPELTPEQNAAFGPYALSYQELFDFTRVVEQSVAECGEHMAAISGKVSGPEDLVAHKDEIKSVRDFIAQQPEIWGKLLEKLQADKEEFTLHPDVAALYDRLFIGYTAPVEQVTLVVRAMVALLDSNLDLAALLAEHEGDVEFQNNMIVFADESVHRAANELLAAINKKSQELYSCQENLTHYLSINKI